MVPCIFVGKHSKFKVSIGWSSHYGSVEMNLTSIHEDAGWIPGLTQWVYGSSIAVSCGVDCRHGLDLIFLWLWCKLAAAALI